jgi:hypothetical protein
VPSVDSVKPAWVFLEDARDPQGGMSPSSLMRFNARTSLRSPT